MTDATVKVKVVLMWLLMMKTVVVVVMNIHHNVIFLVMLEQCQVKGKTVKKQPYKDTEEKVVKTCRHETAKESNRWLLLTDVDANQEEYLNHEETEC